MAHTSPVAVRFGPAGWSYKDWEGVVYPRPHPRGFDPLEYLAAYFDTVEINSSFYRPIAPSTAHQWLERIRPFPNFRFTAKLYQRFTHQRDTGWTGEELEETRVGLDLLHEAGALGAVLLQFPWSFRRTDENREWLRDLAHALRPLPLVLEVRHASWNTPELYQSLAERGIGFVNIDQPLFHDSIRPSARTTASVGYVRVHGRNFKDWFRKDAGPAARYDYLYSAKELKPWADRVETMAKAPGVKEIYVVTNNHFRGKAPANALMLEGMVKHLKPKAPPTLVDAYPEALEEVTVPAQPAPPGGSGNLFEGADAR